MENIKFHIGIRLVSQLLLAALVLAVFFGQGVHLHFPVHDLFHHHDSTIVLHSHDGPEEDQESHSQDAPDHEHPVVSIALIAQISHTGCSSGYALTDVHIMAVLQDTIMPKGLSDPPMVVHPPPDITSFLSSASLSLRGPPQT